MDRKGQISLQQAPMVVLVVGLVFLLMATVAFVGNKYGSAMPTSAATVNNETTTEINESGARVIKAGQCNFQDFTVVIATNGTGMQTIETANYTTTTDGYIKYASATTEYNSTTWNVSYSYSFSGAGCNVTHDLETELLDNTSIAGIVLTIALIGIVLSVLIGIFVGIRAKRAGI